MGNMTWTDDGKYSGRLWTEGKLYTQKWENMKLWTEGRLGGYEQKLYQWTRRHCREATNRERHTTYNNAMGNITRLQKAGMEI